MSHEHTDEFELGTRRADVRPDTLALWDPGGVETWREVSEQRSEQRQHRGRKLHSWAEVLEVATVVPYYPLAHCRAGRIPGHARTLGRLTIWMVSVLYSSGLWQCRWSCFCDLII